MTKKLPWFLPMNGATCWEWQVKRLWGRILKPKFWCRRNWPFLRFTWCDKDGNVPEPKKEK